MKPQVARAALCLLSPAYMAVYLFVLFVATATSGNELVRAPGAWYAAIAPLAYVGIAGAHAYGFLKRSLPSGFVVALHVAAAPAVFLSFLGLGLLLPVVAGLWWLMARERASVALNN